MEENKNPLPNITIAKTAVIVLGILLIMMLGLMGYGIYKKTQNNNYKMFEFTTAKNTDNIIKSAVIKQNLPQGNIDLILPDPCKADDILINYNTLIVKSMSSCGKMFIFDYKGQKISEITISK